MMIRNLTRREVEILAHSLRRWSDLERTAGNTIAAALIDDVVRNAVRAHAPFSHLLKRPA